MSEETRFRRGSLGLVGIGILSALSSTAIYKGVAVEYVAPFDLATPFVLDTVAAKWLGRWLWAEQIHYVCYVLSLVAAALFALIGGLCLYGSVTGEFFSLERVFGPFAKVGQALGIAHLVGARLLYFAGLLFYVADAVIAFWLESVLRSWFPELRMLMLMNLAFHCVVLVFLLWGFIYETGAEQGHK